MTELGGPGYGVLTVDLRSVTVNSSDDLWDALMTPCGLPTWFGRNLNAWWDTIEAGMISETIDRYESIDVLVAPAGIFSPGDQRGAAFLEITNRSHYARAEVRLPDASEQPPPS